MAKRSKKKKDALPLFDLPLQQGEEAGAEGLALNSESSEDTETAPRESAETPKVKQTSLFEIGGEEAAAAESEDLEVEETEIEELVGEEPAPLLDRLLAGFADLMVHAVLLGVAAAATVALGVPLRLELWPPFAVLGFVLSFLYWTVPLAFWGQTPGMAWIGNSSRSVDDEPLSFGQAVLRWIGALTTVAFAGLPILLALGGRSLSDRMSDSKTMTL